MAEENRYDTSRPFLAIVRDAIDGGYFDKTNQVYLINPLDKPLTNVYEQIGGFFSTEDAVLEAKPTAHGPYEVAPHSALALEATSDDEFDELVCWWSIKFDLDGETKTCSFDAGKGIRDTIRVPECPVLGRTALVVQAI